MSTKDTSRLVLEGVPRVGFYGDMQQAGIEGCPEDITFPSCLRSLMHYLGEESLGCKYVPEGEARRLTQCSYAYLMSLCGQAFSLSWNSREWAFGSGNVLNLTDEALAPVRWALEGAGYSFIALGNPAREGRGVPLPPGGHSLFPDTADEAAFRGAIVASIQAGRPVLGFGVVGPPECCLITGYDEGGDVLTGWSFFQGFPEFSQGLEFEPSGYFRKRGWFRDTLGIVVLTDKTAPPDPRELQRRTLERALAIMRTPRVRDTFAGGIAAFDAWMGALLDDTQFEGDIETLRQRHRVHNDAVGNLAEYRAYGGNFLREMAKAFPGAFDELGQAAGCFAVEHDLMWRVWECEMGHPAYVEATEDHAVILARHKTRERIVAVLRQAKARDEEAAGHIERALEAIPQPPGHDVGALLAAPANGMANRASATPRRLASRALLEGVPYIGFDTESTGGQPKNTFICAAMEAALEYLGEPQSYGFLMGVSGAAFRLAWNAERWDGGNISTLNMGEDPTEHCRRAFAAIGWVPQVVGNVTWRDFDEGKRASIYQGPDYLGASAGYLNEALFRQLLIENLRLKRYPLLSIGTIFPPECGLIFGYDEGGDVVIGRQHFQNWPENIESGKLSFEPDGSYRKRDWFIDTVGLVAFDYKTVKPLPRDTYLAALEWASKLGRTPRFRHYHSGLAAYDAWAEALGRDEEFAAADAAGLAERLMCHNDAIACIGEGRMFAAPFLREAARVLPRAAESLEKAALAYEAEGESVEKIIAALGGFGYEDEFPSKLARPEVRAAIVPLIREARARDETALGHIERALERVNRSHPP